MAEVLLFPGIDQVELGKSLRNVREQAELSLVQAAVALEISPVTLDAWEQGRKPQSDPTTVASKYKAYRDNTNYCQRNGNNLIFGVFPLRVARDVLGLSVEELAASVGYSQSSWTKIEANARILPNDKLFEIEGRLMAVWDSACQNKRGLGG